ncbi:MAG: Holliday junction resolvase RuvX [Candidatus Omnitrophota bacterium]
MRILGVDMGERRVGVAITDESCTIAQPFTTIENKGIQELVEALKQTAEENNATHVVIGLPLNLDGTVGDSAKKILNIVEHLKQATGLEVTTWDERFTSRQAERHLIALDKSRKRRKEISDQVAATLLLQAYIDWRKKQDV